MKKTIKAPRWANNRKTKIFCKFHYEDGRILDAFITNPDGKNPDWNEIMKMYGAKVLDQNTAEYLKKSDEKNKINHQREKERHETLKNEMLFNAKLEAFSIDEIKNSKNTALKSKIRKAKNLMEIHTYCAVLMMLELQKQTSEEIKQ